MSAVSAACRFVPTPAVAAGAFNVSGISYVGVGQYRLAFATALDNANFMAVVTGDTAADEWRVTSKTTTYVIVSCFHAGAAADASGNADVIVVGGLA